MVVAGVYDLGDANTSSDGPIQLMNGLMRLLDIELITGIRNQDDTAIAEQGDRDVSGELVEGYGSGGGGTIHRLREGIERFLTTDINNAAASAQAQSTIFILFDHIATGVSVCNHIPGGASALYLDGHVDLTRCQEFDGAPPVIGSLARGLGIIAALTF